MNRFRRKASDTVLTTPWLRVMRHRVEDTARGTERDAITLEQPDWVNVIPYTEDGHVVMVRQHRFGTDGDSLEIPGGLIDPGESPAVAAARELREETGYVAKTWRDAGWCHPNPALQSNRLFTFVAEGCTLAGAQSLDESEDCRVELIPVAELRDRIARREITHALALMALLEDLLARAAR